jgi:nonsense-mediated mRNA decay protein 3
VSAFRSACAFVDLESSTDEICRSKASEQLLSADTHSHTANFKFTYSVEIVPLCKDDLVCIPLKQAKQLSNINPLTLVMRIGSSIQMIDPSTLQLCDISSQMYWRTPFDALANVSDLVEFTVLDIESSGHKRGKWILADAQVALSGAFKSTGVRESDGMMDYESSGFTNQIFHTRTHLGSILQPGDAVMGYHISNANYNSDEFAALSSARVPDVILVKKAYPNRRKKNKPRGWRLKSMAKEAGEEGETGGGRGVVGRMGGRDKKKVEEDYELFLRDLEEDLEMRGAVNLYKAENEVRMANPGTGMGSGGKGRNKAQFAMDVDQVQSVPEQQDEQEVAEEEEADFPEVRLDELLEEFDEMTLGESGET